MVLCCEARAVAPMIPESLRKCIDWYASPCGTAAPDADQYCQTRDVFEGRLARLLTYARGAGLPEADSALLTAVAGEIGNNSFDHNLGHWRDQPGCYFAFTLEAPTLLVWVADRGLVGVSGRALLAFGGLGPTLLGSAHRPCEQEHGMLTVLGWRAT